MDKKMFDMARSLTEDGYYIGPRDPDRNSTFEGQYMVCEDATAPASTDASSGGYCIVGDNLNDLVTCAYNNLHGWPR